MIKRELTFVSGVQEFVLVDFISQNKDKCGIKLKLVKIVFIKKFPYENEQSHIYIFFFEFLSCY